MRSIYEKKMRFTLTLLFIIALFTQVSSAQNERPSIPRSGPDNRNVFKNVIGFVIRLIDIPREKVKHTNDGKAKFVNSRIHDVTIEGLASLRRPHMIFFRCARTNPVEFRMYRAQGILEAYRVQLDGDYHLVIRGESGKTMIVEIPDPRSVRFSSPFRNEIAQARNDFLNTFHPTRHWQKSDQRITVSGIGFWDYPHFQRGAAPNTIEIHPVLTVAPAE